MKHLCAAFCAALLLSAGPARAQDVTLTAPDGAVEISGTLLGFDGEFYRLRTQYGELTVDGSGVLCNGPGCPNLENYVAELQISGSATLGQVLMPALLEAFALRSGLNAERVTLYDRHFRYDLSDKADARLVGRFAFRLTNTDEGFADLLADEADIVMAQREIDTYEARLAADIGLGDLRGPNRSRVLALDALLPVVAPGNPVGTISFRDLARVLAGQIDNWAELGGVDVPISVHLREPGAALAQVVETRLMGPPRLSLASNVQRHATNDALAQAVAADPFGLGMASFSKMGNTRPLVLTGTCGFSLRATRRTIKTEDYPLTVPMFLYLPARRLPRLARDFLTFTRSPAAQIVIRRAGFVDQAPEEVPVDLQGDRFANAISAAGSDVSLADLQQMVRVLTPMVRLTTSFRFEAGSSLLDAQSRSNVQQLARAIEAGQYDTRRLAFVGFSDGQGPAEANRGIAQRRADAVLTAVIAAAETVNLDALALETQAFGEQLPMACDDTAWGRQVNRRVEIWVQ